MHSEIKAPGLKIRRNKDGTTRLLWVARADLVTAGYEPRTVRLHYAIEADGVMIKATCRRLQAEMLEWAAGHRHPHARHDGTLASLIRRYQHDEASPYRLVKWNTRRTYDQVMDTIERAFGKRAMAALGIADFRRWYEEAKKPKAPGGAERVRKAHGIIAMLRRLLSYGVMAELPECARLATILREARFKQPKRRRMKLELHHVEAFIKAALAAERPSLALGTALQFETTLRQRDVIGEYEPAPDGAPPSGIVLAGPRGTFKRWVGGLTWTHIGPDLVLTKETTKTGAVVSHDLNLCPLVLDVLRNFPERGVGPVILNEVTGCPYTETRYTRAWRKIARTAGIPDAVWNMDARAGGISEADDAGAALDSIRAAAGHNQASTTVRYIRGTIGKSREVAEKRQAHRNRVKQDANKP